MEGSHPEYLVCYTTGYLARPKAAGNFKHQLTCHFCPTLHAKLNATSPFPSCTTSGKHSAQSTSPCTTLLWFPVTPLSLLSLCSFLVSFLTPPLPTPKCCHPSLEGSVLSSLLFRLYTFSLGNLTHSYSSRYYLSSQDVQVHSSSQTFLVNSR